MLHCFLCTSPLYPEDPNQDSRLHQYYLNAQIGSQIPDWVTFSVIQNGCTFQTGKFHFIRNPFPKNIAYNWLLCDVNCQEDYWLFLPEDCLISAHGWKEIQKQIKNNIPCFGLSKDPKALVGFRGTFSNLSKDLEVLCDMNCLGKEIGGAVLRGELERHGFHCIARSWKRISVQPKRWGNELYEEINPDDNLDSNASLSRPIFQDYGLDGWKASPEVLQSTFMKIVDKCLILQREAADRSKHIVSHYGPLITELPYKGVFQRMIGRIKQP